jgi:hypothetical protein
MIQECIIIRTGADTSDVIVGHRLNDRPLSRAEADHLAHASASAAPSSASEPAKAPAPDNLAPEPVPPAPSPAPKPKPNARRACALTSTSMRRMARWSSSMPASWAWKGSCRSVAISRILPVDRPTGSQERRVPIPSVARLDFGRPPDDVPQHRWRQFVDDCKNFLSPSEKWGGCTRRPGRSTAIRFQIDAGGEQSRRETGDAVLEGHHRAAHCRCANRSPGRPQDASCAVTKPGRVAILVDAPDRMPILRHSVVRQAEDGRVARA